ncbi:DUF3775 domain-containing protein [Pseudoalteromonas sp. L23]|uniref:DUF3775 domain-containing protein n=1 Tax=unclassified Pseudoalteromonas TaxID=194690 RepID=UPI001EF0CC4E|nr:MULTISPECIES: DUF3775 domain-containing protein [unclassified Pseudoalteromonas]MCF7512971.1 DUF3775 domain-containing protein [Pseudoalteromonas sp. L7]MCF7525011.1 DUF3775 domain-containing protein [Pseudoalteromonas sp. L23]
MLLYIKLKYNYIHSVFVAIDKLCWRKDIREYEAKAIKEIKMLSISLETVQDIMAKAQLAYPPTNESNVICGKDISIEELSSISDEEKALKEAIAALTNNELAELGALMVLGRGAGGETVADFDDLVAEAPSDTRAYANYISEKTPLATYLKNGLSKLGFAN